VVRKISIQGARPFPALALRNVWLFALFSLFSFTMRAHAAPDYLRDVKPILEQKCVTCHACYDAPCQLNLQSADGLERGASKAKVYDGGRLSDAVPTRLHLDANTISEWREKGFFSVMGAPGEKDAEAATQLLRGMLTLGREHPVEASRALPDQFEVGISRENACPKPGEFAEYAKETPEFGMPYGLTGLTDSEYTTLMNWLDAGAPVSHQKQGISPGLRMQIASWELFFNRSGKREQLVSRYLYEHLFLAHLYFVSDAHQKRPMFFRLVRSRTPSGQPIDVIATRRVNEDPGSKFYYRFMVLDESIVHKTHITYGLSEAKRSHLQALFFAEDWSLDALPGYDADARSNPFVTFAAIPAKARYQFMLDDAEYFTRNFIRGPVCHGPIATAVIRDQFWTFFEDPETDQFVNDAAYRKKVSPLLGVPGQKTDLLSLGTEWLKYSDHRNDYLSQREAQYRKAFPDGAVLSHIWDGDTHNDEAYLTIFRHHDNASVQKGLHGRVPRTVWLMDYPLLERSYYELVVGFDVFGSVSHQAQTRLYFDLIRNGSEQNMLRFLPADVREALYDNWYQKSGLIKVFLSYHDLDTETPSGIVYTGSDPLAELMHALIRRNPRIAGVPDRINRCEGSPCFEGVSELDAGIEAAFHPLTTEPAKSLQGIKLLPNVSFVRVDLPEGGFKSYTLIRNRAHSNVAFILGEDLRYMPDQDTATVLPFLLGSYPNFIFRLRAAEVERFVKALRVYSGDALPRAFIDRWGVRRSDPEFWDVYQGFVDQQLEQNPLEAGIYDLNRYMPW